jgi:hypothetical protein
MRPGCLKVESSGSFWWIDEEAGEYMRMPKVEHPREYKHYSDGRAGLLQDGVWHRMTRWWIDEGLGALRIEVPTTTQKIFAPHARIVGPT